MFSRPKFVEELPSMDEIDIALERKVPQTNSYRPPASVNSNYGYTDNSIYEFFPNGTGKRKPHLNYSSFSSSYKENFTTPQQQQQQQRQQPRPVYNFNQNESPQEKEEFMRKALNKVNGGNVNNDITNNNNKVLPQQQRLPFVIYEPPPNKRIPKTTSILHFDNNKTEEQPMAASMQCNNIHMHITTCPLCRNLYTSVLNNLHTQTTVATPAPSSLQSTSSVFSFLNILKFLIVSIIIICIVFLVLKLCYYCKGKCNKK